MNKYHCAVLLAAYQGETYLAQQVDSILSQQGVAVTLWLSVDQCSDNTLHIAQTLAASDSRIHLLSGERHGSAAAHFLFLLTTVELKAFDAVALADQDDIWHADHLERAMAYLASGAAAYSSNVVAFWPDGRRWLVDKAQPQREFDYLFESAGPGCTFVLAASAVTYLQARLQHHQAHLAGVKHHDWLIYALIRGIGLTWIIDPKPSLDYRQHQNNELGVNRGLRALIARAKRVLGSGGFEQAVQIATIAEVDAQAIHTIRAHRRWGYVAMGIQAHRYRRRFRDQCFFALLCFWWAIKPR